MTELRGDLAAALGPDAAQRAIDVFAAWAAEAATEAENLDTVACLCGTDHRAAARAFRHVGEVLTLVYDATPTRTPDHPNAATSTGDPT